MNTKMSGILAASLLAMMAIAPLGMAHDDDPVGTNTRVSGNYVGAAGPWVRFNGTDIFAGNALCDLEILSDGDISTPDDNFLDEPYADGDPTIGAGINPITNGPDNQQDEGAWDDGGNGAVCHTPNTHYNTGAFNTQNCSYTPAHAADDNSAVAWISTGCDYITNVPDPSDPSIIQLVVDAAGCAVNAVITNVQTAVGEIVFSCVDRLIDCTIGIVNLDPTDTCPAGAGGQACGPDGTIDDGSAGNGNTAAGVAFPTTYPYAPTPTTTGTCAPTQGVASVFVWDGVEVDTEAQQITYFYATTGSVS